MPATMVETDVIKNAVRLACRAPSLHNSQPWTWKYQSGRLHLFLDPSRVMNSDRSGREALISCGAVLDHLRVAMTAAGWRANIHRFPNANDPNHLASIDFTPTDQVTDGQRRRADAILVRRTDRLPFMAPTDWELFEPVLRSAVDGSKVRLEVMSGDMLHRQLVEASQLADSLRLYNSAYHAELAWWTGAFEVSDGIPYPSLVSVAEGDRVDIGRRFPAPRHGERRPEIPEDHSKVVALSTDGDDRADALASGEALSAVLLECTMAGLATCPVTHITEVRASRELVGALLDHDAVPQVLIRVGVAPAMEEVPPATPRRPLDEVLRVAGD
jgi:nitroreductase